MSSPEHAPKPRRKWHEKNFVTKVMLPALFRRRDGANKAPRFPKLKSGEIALTWIGHSSFLVQTHHHNVLVDPVYANWIMGVKRIRRPGLSLKDLPPCDVVLITHAHFDHLHPATLRRLPVKEHIIVPRNVGGLVAGLGFRHVHELDWWDCLRIGSMDITFVPAKHWGARVLADRHRGYGGFVISSGGRSVYHCGDSSWFDGFEEIGRRLQPEIALLPIGAYESISGRDHHIGPEEAVRAFTDLGAKWLVPMHYQTFPISHEPVDEPLQRLLKSALRNAVSSKIRLLDEGVSARF